MKKTPHERFTPYAAPEGEIDPTYQGGRALLDRFTALERVREKRDEHVITMENIIAALHKNHDEIEKIEEANPHFKEWVEQARLNNEFSCFLERCGSSNHDNLSESALKTRRNFIAEHEDAPIMLAGIVGEMHAKKLLESCTGSEVAHAHPALDVTAGVDLLLYMPSSESGQKGTYYAVQVKTSFYNNKTESRNYY